MVMEAVELVRKAEHGMVETTTVMEAGKVERKAEHGMTEAGKKEVTVAKQRRKKN